MSASLATLATRLNNLEHKYRRLKIGFGGLLLVTLLLGGRTSYQTLMVFLATECRNPAVSH